MSRRVAIALACLLVAVPVAAADDASDDAGGSEGNELSNLPKLGLEPTSLGQAIVGFEPGSLPPATPGLPFQGLLVERVVANGHFLVVRAPDVDLVRQAFAQVPGVLYVEDDVPLSGLVTPNDPRYSSQYGPPQMKVNDAWGLAPGYGSSAITVAVLDTGLLRTHEDFTPGSRFLTGYNYVNGNTNPNDDCGHGTHVIGTVAATTNNGRGVAGMSQATILPMRVLSAVGGLFSVQCTGSTSTVAQAIIDSADQGARVISMSIGGGASSTLENAVNHAWAEGSILVAAAGNDGASNSIDYPGAYANVIAVGATTSTKARASFSDMGPQLDVMAPGDAVWSTTYSSTTSYGTMSGTSMATPHVAGVIALALSCAPSATNTQVRNALTSTTEDLGPAGFDTTYGYGLVRADNLVATLCNGSPPPANVAPTACFTHSENALQTTVNASCSTDSDGTVTSYSWSWGDGTPAGSGAAASHTYAAAGTYTILLTVTDNAGGTASTSQTVTVAGGAGDPDPATPNLQSGVAQSFSVSSGAWVFRKIQVPASSTNLAVGMTGPGSGLDADLYVRVTAKPTSSTYNCRPYLSGNAESCSMSNPQAAWWYVGVYGYSGSGTVTITATVTTPAPNQPPVASFTHSESGLTTSVNGGGSSDPNGNPLTYSWNWGDGTPAGSGVTASHAYAAGGTYTVTLTVNDGQGGTNSQSQSVTVVAPPNQPPVASFTHSAAGLTLSVNGAGSSDPNGNPLTYAWTFGDGATATGVTASRTYAAAGTYSVTLTVNDGQGGSNSQSQSVTVVADPDPTTPNLSNGQAQQVTLSGAGDNKYYKIQVPAGKSQLQVVMTGPACGLLGCSFDSDLYVRLGSKPTDTVYDCRPYLSGNGETCTMTNPAAGWWYIRVYDYAGSGTVTVTATYPS